MGLLPKPWLCVAALQKRLRSSILPLGQLQETGSLSKATLVGFICEGVEGGAMEGGVGEGVEGGGSTDCSQ